MTIKKYLNEERKVSYIDAPIHPETIRKNDTMKVKLVAGGDQEEFDHILPLLKFYTS